MTGEPLTVKHRSIAIATVLIAVVLVSCFVGLEKLQTPPTHTSGSAKPFFVGIETGWDSNLSDCEALIDKVKSYTNLLIIASPLILSDGAMLYQTCDYAYNAGMYIIVYFGNLQYSGQYGQASNQYTPRWHGSL